MIMYTNLYKCTTLNPGKTALPVLGLTIPSVTATKSVKADRDGKKSPVEVLCSSFLSSPVISIMGNLEPTLVQHTISLVKHEIAYITQIATSLLKWCMNVY